MPDDPLLIGLDCSTHGAKAVAWSPHGDAVAHASASFPLTNPRPGWWEQDARDWRKAVVAALSQVARKVGPRVAAIGVTHQRETFVGLDASWRPVRPAIVWMDERAHEDVRALADEVGAQRFHQVTGKPLSMTPSVTKIHWLRRCEPRNFARVARWCDVQSFVIRHLTGEDVTSVGAAGPMGLVDIRAGDWSDLILEAVGLTRRQLPTLVASGTVAGELTDSLARQIGLAPRTQVVATAGDGQVAALGAGILDLRRAYLNLGTAIVAGTVSASYRIDRVFRTMSGAYPGTFLLESDLKGGAFTIDWLMQRVLGGAHDIETLEAQAATLPAGAAGLVLVPYLATVMDPYWDDDASGVMIGLRGDHGPPHLFRAVIEGIALEERLHLRNIEEATGTPLEQVRVLGGGATSDLWCQVLADVLGRPLARTRSPEATSLGAAMLAASAAGVVESIRDAVDAMGGTGESFEPGPDQERYARLYDDVFVGLYPSLRNALGKLARWRREG